MNKAKNLLVLIVSYNHENYIKDCLESVLEQNTKYDVDVICFDDCSTDGTLDILQNIQKKFPEKIKVIKNKKNLGKGRFSIIENSKNTLKIMTTGQF